MAGNEVIGGAYRRREPEEGGKPLAGLGRARKHTEPEEPRGMAVPGAKT